MAAPPLPRDPQQRKGTPLGFLFVCFVGANDAGAASGGHLTFGRFARSHLFCQFCVVVKMRRGGERAAQKHATTYATKTARHRRDIHPNYHGPAQSQTRPLHAPAGGSSPGCGAHPPHPPNPLSLATRLHIVAQTDSKFGLSATSQLHPYSCRVRSHSPNNPNPIYNTHTVA